MSIPLAMIPPTMAPQMKLVISWMKVTQFFAGYEKPMTASTRREIIAPNKMAMMKWNRCLFMSRISRASPGPFLVRVLDKNKKNYHVSE